MEAEKRGPGRPTRAEAEAKKQAGADALEQFHRLATADLGEYYAAMRRLALGAWYEGCASCAKPLASCQCRQSSGVAVYQQLPDRNVLMFLAEQATGKAVQKSAVAPDTEIIIQHQVPRPSKGRHRDTVEEEDEEELSL